MDNTIVFKRTALGQASFGDLQAPLTQRERMLLITVDGRKPTSELRKLAVVIGDCDDLLQRLLDIGMIEVAANDVAAAHVAIAPAATAITHEQFERARLAAPRFINQMLGPYGEKIALLLERSKTVAELHSHLDTAERVLSDAKGAAAARNFRTQIERDLSS
jgi:hypothetical protein